MKQNKKPYKCFILSDKCYCGYVSLLALIMNNEMSETLTVMLYNFWVMNRLTEPVFSCEDLQMVCNEKFRRNKKNLIKYRIHFFADIS